jgi:hypothetical protein
LSASVGLAASIGVLATVRNYKRQGQQGSESTTAFQVPLVPRAPQRAGPIVAQEGETITRNYTPDVTTDAQKELKSIADKCNPVIGYYDPLGLSCQNFWNQGNEATIAWLRHAEIKHGRVAMAGFVGYCVHENHIHWPWKLENSLPDGDWYRDFYNLSAPDIWFKTPWGGRLQIILFLGFFEWWSESNYVLKKDGMKHYMRGGKPGYFPTFNEIPHPVPFNLYDPYNLNAKRSDEWKASKLITEINNGRLAMIGLMGLLCESKIPGSVPPFSGLGIMPMSKGLEVMAPFGTETGLTYITGQFAN